MASPPARGRRATAIFAALALLQPGLSERCVEGGRWEQYEHAYLGDEIPLKVQDTGTLNVSKPAEAIKLGHNRLTGYTADYGELVAANDFWGATSLNDTVCGRWEDFVRAGSGPGAVEAAVRRMSSSEREARFMKFFSMAYTGEGMDDPERIRFEYEREQNAIESALARKLENVDVNSEDTMYALHLLATIETSRAFQREWAPHFKDFMESAHMDFAHIGTYIRKRVGDARKMRKDKRGTLKIDKDTLAAFIVNNYKVLARRMPNKIQSLFRNMSSWLLDSSGLSINHGDALENFKDIGDSRYFWNFNYFIEVAKFNFDHFSPCLEAMYAVGHKLALREAYQAGQAHGRKVDDFFADEQQPSAMHSLGKAYAMNAFADHALSDMFASGHIRTPRVEIAKMCIRPGTDHMKIHTLSAAITAQQMHEEDGRNGLLVTDAEGKESWWAYGDGSLFELPNKRNLEKIVEAMAISREQVYQAWLAGHEGGGPPGPEALTALVLRRQPFVPKLGDPLWKPVFSLANTCPRFRVGDNGELRIREHSDEMARSKAMLLYRQGKLVGEKKAYDAYARFSTCLDRPFIKREPSGKYKDCNSGSEVTKVRNIFSEGIGRNVPGQDAYIANYPKAGDLMQVGGCWRHKAGPAHGKDGALYCKCKNKKAAECEPDLNPLCEVSSACGNKERKPGRCFPAECSRVCRCTSSASRET